MAHKLGRSLFRIGDSSAHPSNRSALHRAALVLLAAVSAALLGLATEAQTSSYVPALITSSVSSVPTTTYDAATVKLPQANVMLPTEVTVDACGNIYALDFGFNASSGTTVTEIPAGGGAATVIHNEGSWYASNLGQDQLHANVIVGHNWSGNVEYFPLVNCVPQVSQMKYIGGNTSSTPLNWYQPGYAVGDFLGNTVISTNSTPYFLLESINNLDSVLQANTPKEVVSPAVDKLQNIYFITDAGVYVQKFLGAKYASPVPFGNYINPVGLTMDVAGNLYVADSSAAAIYEIPNEGKAGLNLADQFTVASGLTINVAAAINSRGDIYYTGPSATSVSELTLGNADFRAVPTGQSASRILNLQFNAAATLTNIQAPAGDFTIQPASPGTTACTASSYPYTVTNKTGPPTVVAACQITVGFLPTSVGKQSSAVAITYTIAGNTITTNVFLEGRGQGALLTLDPGTVTSAGSGFRSPAGAVVDRAGNTFVADIGNNAVMEFPAGGGAAVSVAIVSGGKGVSTPLSGPAAVAVDGAGDVFIADTGNNRVVEVPFVNGALSAAASTVIGSGMKSPASVFVHTNGDLYVADTGNNTILIFPSFAGPSNAGAVFGAPMNIGVGLLSPLAVTVDGPGNVYIADSGNNQIVEYPLGAGQAIVAANILNPSALATDNSGSLFVVDQGNYRVLRIPSVNGTLSPNDAAEVALGVANPYGVTIDSSSNLYVTDRTNAAAYTITRSQIGLDFGGVNIGTATAALPLTVESAGNLPLVFSAPFFTGTVIASDFAMTSPANGACGDGLTLPSGTNCDLTTTFMPTKAGSRSATIVLASNALNAAQVTVTGTGVSPSPTTTTLAVIPSVPGAPFYGEPLSVTATVAPTTGTGTPTGFVSFVLDGTQIALLPVTKGVATLHLNSGLTGGKHSMYGVYKGDLSDNASSSVASPILIAQAPTTSNLTVTTVAYVNPYSLRHSNAGSCSVTDNLGYTNQSPVILSDGIGFTATVTSPGVGVPSGTLTFYSDGKLINGTPDLKTGLDPNTGLKPATSVTPVLPFAGGLFLGKMSSDADTLRDGTTKGENDVFIGPHVITVVYSGDQNYLPSTSTSTTVIVTDVSPTTPLSLPQSPVSPAPYCDANSSIKGSRPSDPGSFAVAASSPNITASADAPGTTTLTFSSMGGWAGGINVACPDLPQYTTCSTNPGQATVLSSSPGATVLPSRMVLTVTTNVPPYIPTATQSGFFWLTSVFVGLLIMTSRRRFRQATGALTIAAFALLLFVGIAGLAGCGSSTSPSVVTKPGSYPMTVTFTSAQAYHTQYNEVTRADLPYKMSFTLNVK